MEIKLQYSEELEKEMDSLHERVRREREIDAASKMIAHFQDEEDIEEEEE